MKSWPVEVDEDYSESLVWPLGSHIWSSFTQIHMKSWPKVKLGQVGVDSNTAQNHSSSPKEVISAHYLPQFTWKVDRLKSTKITQNHSSWPRKSYLVIICLNSHEKLTKSEIRSSWSRFQHCSESLVWPHTKSYLLIICPNSHEKLTKSEIMSSWSRFEDFSESLV